MRILFFFFSSPTTGDRILCLFSFFFSFSPSRSLPVFSSTSLGYPRTNSVAEYISRIVNVTCVSAKHEGDLTSDLVRIQIESDSDIYICDHKVFLLWMNIVRYHKGRLCREVKYVTKLKLFLFNIKPSYLSSHSHIFKTDKFICMYFFVP